MKKLILEFIKAMGRKPNAIETLKLKARFRDQNKIIQFPKDRITDWWKPRPGEKAAKVTPIKKSISDEAATSHVQKLQEDLPFMSRKELHQLRTDVVNRKAFNGRM